MKKFFRERDSFQFYEFGKKIQNNTLVKDKNIYENTVPDAWCVTKRETSSRILEEAKETLQTSLAPLAAKIAKAIATIASSDSFKSFLKTMGDVMGWIAKHPKLVMAAVGLKMISSLIPKPVYLVGKGGKMLSGMSNMFSKGGGTGTKALSKASAKGLSSKQIAAGFGGKAAKDQLEKQGGKMATKGVGKLGAKTLGKSINPTENQSKP